MADRKLIGAFEVPSLDGLTDEQIEQLAGALADQIADALIEQGEQVVRDERGRHPATQSGRGLARPRSTTMVRTSRR